MRYFNYRLFTAVSAAVIASSLQAQQSDMHGKDKVAGEQEKKQVIMPRIDVVGVPENLTDVSGTANVLDQETLEQSRVFTVNEALRKVPGIHARDEEGLGLRPNIGIRGLNPTRSTKINLLEDGVPLSYAPYGDNASYYHPPIERFESIEILKGADQIRFGPQTIGGVINYITPTPPQKFGGHIQAIGGSRDYFNGKLQVGGRGLLFDFTHKQSDGARDNIHSELRDYNLKYVVGLTDNQALTLRANYYTEDSQLTYSGLTTAEFNNFGARYNPFKNDKFNSGRVGLSATHDVFITNDLSLTTNLYFARFDRDWWRAASTTTDTQCGSDFTTARAGGQAIDVNTCGTQGRLREYYTWGVEPRLRYNHNLLGVQSNLDFGFRAHFETQDRRQVNIGQFDPTQNGLREDNVRETQAYSWFMTNRFNLGQFTATPGIRYEYIDYERRNRMSGVSGGDNLDAWLPSLGLTWNPHSKVTAFASAHRGFAPPRTEDVIGGTGTSTDVGAEKSVNWEVGARVNVVEGVNLQASFFRNDFQKQIAVGSIAGGSTPLAQGETLYQGVEFSGRIDMPFGTYIRTAYTWLPTARQESPFTRVDTGAVVPGSAHGNRLPYAPEHLVTAAVGFAKWGLDSQIEAVHVSRQFSDFANTVASSENGQAGLIDPYTIFNLAINYHHAPLKTTFFFMIKNLTDDVYIVDRTRGIIPGMPRLFQGGIRYTF
ncbi:MAG: TonB-dependent receptor [Nitrosomonas sp.]|nr:TonB-dependent receptor [Nitrosomonas sp.]